jgi:hypothetical protein
VSYQAQAYLSRDTVFQERIQMCVAEQAQEFVADDRPEYKQLAYQAVAAFEATTVQFVPLVAMRPGMTGQSTDDDILAAVQYLWPVVGERYVPGVAAIGMTPST